MTYLIAIRHNAYGIEGERMYTGTELGAKRAANKMARQAGYGWTAIVREQE